MNTSNKKTTKSLSQKAILLLGKYDSNKNNELLNIIDSFQLNQNQSIEFLTILNELELKYPEFHYQNLTNIEIKDKNKANEFINNLRNIRYPIHSKLKNQLSLFMKKLTKKNIKINYKDNFEKNNFDIQINIKNEADIENTIEYFEKNKLKLKELLAFIQKPNA